MSSKASPAARPSCSGEVRRPAIALAFQPVNVVRARRAAALIGLPTWISLRHTRPLSDHWGFDRGTPVDRLYVSQFLDECRTDIRGDVLEVKDSAYTRLYGGAAVVREHVFDIDATNPDATVVADLNEPESVPVGAFDCILLTQMLQFIRLPEVALANACSALRPSGTLLLTVPAVSRVDRAYGDYWRFTLAGLEELLGRSCPEGRPEVRSYGNVLACAAFLFGLAAQELRPDRLRDHDPENPLVVCARVVKPG